MTYDRMFTTTFKLIIIMKVQYMVCLIYSVFTHATPGFSMVEH